MGYCLNLNLRLILQLSSVSFFVLYCVMNLCSFEAVSHRSSSDEIEKAGCDDNDPSSPDAQPSSTPSWKERSQMLLQIMRQGNSGVDHSEVPHGPHTTAFELCQLQPQSASSSTKKPNRTSYVGQYHKNASPPSNMDHRDRCVRFAQVSFANTKPDKQDVFPANDPSDPDQVDAQECKRCKNMVNPGSACSYCHTPCPKRRTRKVKTAEQLAKPTSNTQGVLENSPSVLLTEKVALPPSVSSGQQQNPSSSPLSQANPGVLSPPALSEHTGEPFYPPSYQKGSSSFHQKPTVAGSSFPKQPPSSGATALAQVDHHPTDFDQYPLELKRQKEAEWFSQCSPEKQEKYLQEKQGMGDKIDHLLRLRNQVAAHMPLSKEDPNLITPPSCDIESHHKKRQAEAEWFSQLSPAEQRKKFQEKKALNDEVEHLLPHLKQEREHVKTGRKMVDEQVMASLQEERKREQMKKDGAIFVHHIKVAHTLHLDLHLFSVALYWWQFFGCSSLTLNSFFSLLLLPLPSLLCPILLLHCTGCLC